MKYSILVITITIVLFGAMSCATSKKTTNKNQLQGTWVLNYISGKRIAFDGLYPDKKPQITFDVATKEITGNSSCNGFGCKYTIEQSAITFGDPIGTMMACGGSGEQDFYQMLKKVNKYSVDNNKLVFLIDDIAVMRFTKK